MREKFFDRTTAGPGIEDAVALDDEPPRLIERVLAIGGIGAGHLRGLDKEGPWVSGWPDQPGAVPVDIRLELCV